MKKYKYVYQVRTNNLCCGCLVVRDNIPKLADARQIYKSLVEKYGYMDIIKHRIYL